MLKRALTHSSYANENRSAEGSNERLEFLGDSVLSVIVAEHIFRNFKHLPEGELTKIRASVVCESALYEFSKELDIGSYLLLGKGEVINGGNKRPSILADAFEAVLAAIYLDGGIESARKHVLRFVDPKLRHLTTVAFKDYKTALQEVIQKNPEEELQYVLTGESGPDHAKVFTVEVHLNSNVIGKRQGSEQKACRARGCKAGFGAYGREAMSSHANISVFVPHIGCPNRCSFCDQIHITGTATVPTAEDVKKRREDCNR